jgi:hypothetical protein
VIDHLGDRFYAEHKLNNYLDFLLDRVYIYLRQAIRDLETFDYEGYVKDRRPMSKLCFMLPENRFVLTWLIYALLKAE